MAGPLAAQKGLGWSGTKSSTLRDGVIVARTVEEELDRDLALQILRQDSIVYRALKSLLQHGRADGVRLLSSMVRSARHTPAPRPAQRVARSELLAGDQAAAILPRAADSALAELPLPDGHRIQPKPKPSTASGGSSPGPYPSWQPWEFMTPPWITGPAEPSHPSQPQSHKGLRLIRDPSQTPVV